MKINYFKIRHSGWAALISCVTLAYIALGAAAHAAELPLEQVQVAGFVLLLTLGGLFSPFVQIPLPILALAAAAGVTAIAFSHTYIGSGRGSFMVARLRQDDFEIDSRIFREDIKRELGRLSDDRSVNPVRYHSPIATIPDSIRLFDRVRNPVPMVWGSKFWLNISFPEKRGTFFPAEALRSWNMITGVQPVTSVPWIGISMRPRADTVRFVSLLFLGALGAEPAALLTNSSTSGRIETYLRTAAWMNAGWSLFAHRAYAYWLVGNLYLARGLANGRFEPGEVACAIASYSRAKALVRVRDNPPLYAAVLNNRAYALIIQAIVQRRKDLRVRAVRDVQAATSVLFVKSKLELPRDAARVALENFLELKRRNLVRPAKGFVRKVTKGPRAPGKKHKKSSKKIKRPIDSKNGAR